MGGWISSSGVLPVYYDKEMHVCEGFSVPDSGDIGSTKNKEDGLSQGEEEKAQRETSIPEKGQKIFVSAQIKTTN